MGARAAEVARRRAHLQVAVPSQHQTWNKFHATIEILNLAVVTRHHEEQLSSQETLGISQRLVVSPYHQILGNSQDFGLSSGPVSECYTRSGSG